MQCYTPTPQSVSGVPFMPQLADRPAVDRSRCYAGTEIVRSCVPGRWALWSVSSGELASAGDSLGQHCFVMGRRLLCAQTLACLGSARVLEIVCIEGVGEKRELDLT